MQQAQAPSPKLTDEPTPLFPYAESEDLTNYPPELRLALERYVERMGFLPNALKLYLHRPEIALTLWTLNDRIMRDPSSTLDRFLKRRLGAVASKTNGCTYCTSHHCAILKSPVTSGSEGWGLEDAELQDLMAGRYEPKDEFERVCFDFVRAASSDPANVGQDIYDRLVQLLTPAQIIELAHVVGFWKYYNTVHDSLRVPLESGLLPLSGYVDL